MEFVAYDCSIIKGDMAAAETLSYSMCLGAFYSNGLHTERTFLKAYDLYQILGMHLALKMVPNMPLCVFYVFNTVVGKCFIRLQAN